MFDPKTLDQLAQALVARMIPPLQTAPPSGSKVAPRLLTVKQTAEYLGRSVSAIYKLRARREIACVIHGRNLRFDRIELDRWIQNGKV